MKLHQPHFQSDRTASWLRRLLACVVILMGCVNLPAETPSNVTISPKCCAPCALFEAATNSSIDIPISTCLTRECRGSTDPVLSQVFDCDNYYVGLTAAPSCAQRMMSLRAKQPDAPGFVTQLQGGWFALVGDRLSKAMPLTST